jgi:Family of unknown function (DUF6510)
MQVEDMRLDGNAAGGVLREIFSRDVTAARATCMGCGASVPIGSLLDYGGDMGVILRCPACDAVMLRIVRTASWLRFDASGTALFLMPESQ